MREAMGAAAMPARARAELEVERGRRDVAIAERAVVATQAAIAAAQSVSDEVARLGHHPMAPVLARMSRVELEHLRPQRELVLGLVEQERAWLASAEARLAKMPR